MKLNFTSVEQYTELKERYRLTFDAYPQLASKCIRTHECKQICHPLCKQDI